MSTPDRLDDRADEPTLLESLGASPGTALIAGATIIWLLLVTLGAAWPLTLLELGYLLVVPGLAITRAAGLRTSPASLSLAVVLSVGLVGIAEGILIAAGLPDELLLRAIVVAVTIAALAVDEYVTPARAGVSLEVLADPDPSGARGHHRL